MRAPSLKSLVSKKAHGTRLQGVHHVAGSTDLRGLLALERPRHDGGDLRGERRLVSRTLDRTVVLGQERFLVDASQRAHQEAAK